ncbi:ECF transporter S component [Pseudoglutamicibacter cumminsii]|uniref:ECF transporter S component n=1 Tax=Pseudoglutamicibacter cumminsii TaxID=156979 RepID=UPI00195BB2AC|nr:ECF transporter S component [Pseudoglutamicibacter cumminsii]
MPAMQRFAAHGSKYGQLTLFMVPLGIAINFIAGQIVLLLKLPVYMDAIGTILVGAVCGPLPGALVGLLTNLINAITLPTLVPYAIVSVLIGLAAGWLARVGWFRNVFHVAFAALIFALIGGFIGSLITIWVFGGLSASGVGWVTGILRSLGVGETAAVYLASMPLDFIDKVPSAFIAWLIILRMPTRVLVKLPLGDRYLKPPKKHDALADAQKHPGELTLGR